MLVMANPPVTGPLKSELLSGNQRLQDCARFDPKHVQPRDPQSEHVRLIQEALRQVFGATIPESEKDYGDETTKAVVAFKTDRGIFTRGTKDKIDPIVGINTIRKLDELLKAEDDRRKGRGGGGEITPSVVVRPDGPNPGEANRSGFSAARLSRGGPGQEWSRRDPLKPISQFIPLGQTRKLIVEVKGGGGVSFRVDREQIAAIKDSDDRSVTLVGNARGHALLTISVEGGTNVKVDLVVRPAISIPVDVFHLGPPKIPGAAASFQSLVLPMVNNIWTSQTNITFTAGATGQVDHMIMDGQDTVIDTDLPLFFSAVIGPPDPRRPTLRFADLQRQVKDAKAATCFVSPNIRDQEGDNILGRGGVRTRVCWFKIGAGSGQSIRGAPAHEFGHALGLPHITASGTDTFLMHPSGDTLQNNTIMPSETLDDLMD
jgi:hypothetical protein